MSRTTLSRYLIEAQRDNHINADLRFLIEVVARACKAISILPRRRVIRAWVSIPGTNPAM